MEKEKKSKVGLIVFLSVTLIIAIVGAILLYTQVINKVNKDDKDNNNNNGNNNVTEKEQITPLMYEITKEGSNNKIYLIGSIHFADLEKIEFPKYVTDAYDKSDYLACEFDILKAVENIDQNEATKDYFYTYPDSLEKHVSNDTYKKIVKFMNEQFKYTEERVKTMSLEYIESMLTQLVLANSNIGAQSGGVDTYYLDKAHNENKKILEVESYEFQSKLTKSFPDRVQELSILNTIDYYQKSIDELNKLYESWKYGKVDELEKLLIDIEDDDNYTKEDLDMMIDYNKKMLDDRNIGMKNKLEEYFSNNYTVFYMVGAAHLIGDNGIAHLLELDGYTVTRVK